MALIKETLASQLLSLFTDMREKEENADSEYADRMATIIDDYIKTATITVPAGIAVSTTGSATAQTGATTAPATAAIS